MSHISWLTFIMHCLPFLSTTASYSTNPAGTTETDINSIEMDVIEKPTDIELQFKEVLLQHVPLDTKIIQFKATKNMNGASCFLPKSNRSIVVMHTLLNKNKTFPTNFLIFQQDNPEDNAQLIKSFGRPVAITNNNRINTVAINEAQTHVALGREDGSFALFNLVNYTEVPLIIPHCIKLEPASVIAVGFDNVGNFLVCTENKTLLLFDQQGTLRYVQDHANINVKKNKEIAWYTQSITPTNTDLLLWHHTVHSLNCRQKSLVLKLATIQKSKGSNQNKKRAMAPILAQLEQKGLSQSQVHIIKKVITAQQAFPI